MEDRTCSAPEGCPRTDITGYDLCNKHYQRWKKYGTLDAPPPPPDLADEHWLSVADWEGLYEVSNFGRLRSLPRATSRVIKILKGRPTRDGHLQISLWDGPRVEHCYIHVLVAEAFLGPKPPGTEVLHGPGGAGDNRVVNLSYGTHLDNCDDRARDGRHHYKLTQAKAAEIREKAAAGATRESLAEEYGVRPQMIARVIGNWHWTVGAPPAPGRSKPRMTGAQIEDARRSRANGESVPSIAERLGVSRATIYRLINGETHNRDAA